MKHRIFFSIALVVVCFMSAPQRSLAQGDGVGRAANTLFAEGLGNGTPYSFNYDRLLSSNVALRFGFNFTPSIPVTLSYLLGLSSSDHIELGVGVVPTFGSNPALEGTGILGYRYQQPNGGLFFKAGFTPFLGTKGFIPWGGVGVGLTF